MLVAEALALSPNTAKLTTNVSANSTMAAIDCTVPIFFIPMAIHSTMSAPMMTLQPATPSCGISNVAAVAPDMIMMAVQPMSWITFAMENASAPKRPNERPTASMADSPVFALTKPTR